MLHIIILYISLDVRIVSLDIFSDFSVFLIFRIIRSDSVNYVLYHFTRSIQVFLYFGPDTDQVFRLGIGLDFGLLDFMPMSSFDPHHTTPFGRRVILILIRLVLVRL